MKVADLRINDKIIINGFEHEFLGIQKRRIKGIGSIEQIIFRNTKTQEEKLFDRKLQSRDLKNKNGILEL